MADKEVLSSIQLARGRGLYLKDLGPQIGWTTVFLCEYAGPLFCYLICFARPSLLYANADAPMSYVQK